MTTEFTPLASLGGGALIGLAAVLLMLVYGRTFGATGILSGAIIPTKWSEMSWRWAVLLGMVSGPVGVYLITGNFPEVQIPSSPLMLVGGGLLVGIGVTYGNGCTSGHGVCGMARLSTRSIVATLVFMAATGITVYILRHGLGVY